MKVCVQGQWHLGTVTAACLATVGHEVVGLDSDVGVVANLRNALPPVLEPGLDGLIREGIESGRLSFSSDTEESVSGAKVLWVTFDTPVDQSDQADVGVVLDEVSRVLPYLDQHTLVLISSQLPVGSIRCLEELAATLYPEKQLQFACSPENLRLGQALKSFLDPDRVIVGVSDQVDRDTLDALFSPITKNLILMGIESSEMTKHAINAFLGLSITFINEIASICEKVGADAREVEAGMKSERRIGSSAYLSPGAAFAGGTLARDVAYLESVSRAEDLRSPLIGAVRISNDHHQGWVQRQLASVVGDILGKRICILGLTYKPGTNTLRRSSSVQICNWLLSVGAEVVVHDPSNCELPDNWHGHVVRAESPLEYLDGTTALVVSTPWPEYKDISVRELEERSKSLIVVDANRFLEHLSKSATISYISVGVGI
ncbi:MAG: UDP-glucose 6-dehydrogenase [Acidobacteria bacterium]|nr:UDP-glucose 6-dehydrogenase [Acidobacteriota bacterium]